MFASSEHVEHVVLGEVWDAICLAMPVWLAHSTPGAWTRHTWSADVSPMSDRCEVIVSGAQGHDRPL